MPQRTLGQGFSFEPGQNINNSPYSASNLPRGADTSGSGFYQTTLPDGTQIGFPNLQDFTSYVNQAQSFQEGGSGSSALDIYNRTVGQVPLQGFQFQPTSGQIPQNLPFQFSGVNLLRSEATRQGMSPFAQAALQAARERAGRSTASQVATQQANLAARGGLSSGARERISQGGAAQLGQLERQIGQDIFQSDLAQRAGALRALPGAEVAQTAPYLQLANLQQGARQFDIGTAQNAYASLLAAQLERQRNIADILGSEATAQGLERG